VFEALDAGTESAEAVDAHSNGIGHLLEPPGYVKRRGNGYVPSAMTRT
jgi:hypothetical protein